MYRGNWGRAVLSRAAAVALLCLLTAWLAGVVSAFEVAETEKMTHQELQQHVREGADASFPERYLFSLVSAVVFVALVESLAAGFRAVASAALDAPQPEPLHR
jgi:hypothetical protein